MPYMKLSDVNIFYEEFGKGETVLFLHSHFSRALLAFSGQILPFAGRYHCLYPDFRGHGRTTSESLFWDSRKIADDMAQFLDALKIERAHLIGYSCGAYVGYYMASKYPKKVKSLVTIGGGAYPRPNGADDFLPENLLSRNNTGFIEDMRLRHFDAHKGDWQTYLRMTVADWKKHPNLSDDEWKSIACPAFFINGENDPFGTCLELQEKVPNARIYEVKGGGHRPHFVGEQIDEVNTRILDFLNEIEG
ncbi:MAG: alpha/beta hydrolase [Clostridium sp.]|nr:alpha/beta hydrolase [Clostridium sp.]